MDEIRALLAALRDDRARLDEVRYGHRVASLSAFARMHRLETALRSLLGRSKRA
jgi:hypothetical protein